MSRKASWVGWPGCGLTSEQKSHLWSWWSTGTFTSPDGEQWASQPCSHCGPQVSPRPGPGPGATSLGTHTSVWPLPLARLWAQLGTCWPCTLSAPQLLEFSWRRALCSQVPQDPAPAFFQPSVPRPHFPKTSFQKEKAGDWRNFSISSTAIRSIHCVALNKPSKLAARVPVTPTPASDPLPFRVAAR